MFLISRFRKTLPFRYYSKKSEPAPKKVEKKVDSRRVIKVYRYGGICSGEKPKVQNFDLDLTTCGAMVLDVLIKLKDIDPSLSFRRSCREGICGSCAICLQGHNCLACITEIPNSKIITILPIPHMYVIRDLVVDMNHFFEAYDSIMPYLIREGSGTLGRYQLAQSERDRAKFDGLYECVLCACCSTSCPSYWWNGRRFLGPAALLHAYRWVIDSRDQAGEQRLHNLRDDFKAFRCHTILNCTLACPKGLHPGYAIARLKRLISGLDKKETSDLDPMKLSAGSGSKIPC